MADLRQEAVLSDCMIKFAEQNPKFLLAVMTQELVNHMGIENVIDILEVSLKHFELDVAESLLGGGAKNHKHEDGQLCFLETAKANAKSD